MKFILSFIYLIMLLASSISWAATTYLTLDKVDVFDSPEGNVLKNWPRKTLFTSPTESDNWITISGHFPDGKWQPLATKLFVKKSDKLKVRKPYQEKGAKTVVYKVLKEIGPNAKTYKLLEDTEVFFSEPTETLETVKQETPVVDKNDVKAAQTPQGTQPKPYLGGKMDSADPTEPTLWTKDSVFTSVYENDRYIKASGYVPAGKWEPLEQPIWIKKPVKVQNRTKPRKYERDKDSKRFVVIDKKRFELSVYEVVNGEQHKLMRTPVALGYDRCLPESKGGKCYYTPEGEFEVEFKLFDPDGINWCIPPKMSVEFKNKIAKGERCSRGTMGDHALHFGNSYFLHGTSNPNSIGGRTTHGCVRLRNPDIAMVYQMLKNGDKVLISETPEEFDLVALAEGKTESKVSTEEQETKPTL